MAAPITETKGCLFNIVIYTHSNARTAYFHELINALINKFPCRVIFIEVDESYKQDELKISHLEGVGKAEQITIKTSRKTLPQVSYSLLPLLVPDLPVYLIWGENPTTDNLILPDLIKLATRVIYDSKCSDNLKEFSLQVLKNLDAVHIDFIDIDWALIRGWREVISIAFDSHDKLDLARNCDTVIINYNIAHLRRAIYLQAWIAAQLNWEFVSQINSSSIKYHNGTHEITVILEPKQTDVQPPGDILSILFKSANGNEINFSKLKDQSVVIVHITRGDVCELPFSLRLPNFRRGLGFIKEIFYFRSGLHYRNMLEMLSKSNWKGL